MKEADGKELTVSFTLRVDESIEQEQVADRVGDALGPLKEEVGALSDVAVRTVSRGRGPVTADGGYSSRLWEKATCRTPEVLRNPLSEVEILVREAERLGKQVEALQERIGELGTQLGEG